MEKCNSCNDIIPKGKPLKDSIILGNNRLCLPCFEAYRDTKRQELLSYPKNLDKDQLRNLAIDLILEDLDIDLYVVPYKGRFDVYDSEPNIGFYKLCYSKDYWHEEYEKYCEESTREYTKGLKGYGEKRTEKLIEKMKDDYSQYKDYLELVKDHLEFDESFMEIVY
jgi:hypothetical protein